MSCIARFAVDRGYATDAVGVLEGLQDREAQVSTAMMDGIAIPHTKHAAVTDPALLVLRYTEPVAWPDKDTEVSVAVAMLVPEAEAGKTHLKLLAKVSRALMDDNVRSTLSSGSETEYRGVAGEAGVAAACRATSSTDSVLVSVDSIHTYLGR